METKKKTPFETEALKMARRLFKNGSTVEFVMKAVDTHFKETLSAEQKKQMCTEAVILNLGNAPETEPNVLEQTKTVLEKYNEKISEMVLECGLGEMAELSHLQALSKYITLALKEIDKLNNL